MGRAAKRSRRDPTPDAEPSTSGVKPKRAKTSHKLEPRTAGKKNGPRSGSKCRSKVLKTNKKGKKTLPTMSKTKASKKTAPPMKKTRKGKGKGKALFGHYHRLMGKKATRADKEPDEDSEDGSSISTID